jgi:hypothetical protein
MNRLTGILPLFLMLLLFSQSRQANAETVIFDEGHGQRFQIGESGPLQLTGLAGLFRERGKVTVANAPLTDEVLSSANALVLAGAFVPYSPAEIDAIVRFLNRGGRVAVTIHIGPPLTALLHRLGVTFSNGVISELANVIEGDPHNFRVSCLAPHTLVAGVRYFSLYGVWAVMNTGDNATIIARTSPDAWIDQASATEGIRQSYGVAVAGSIGKGQFVVFGDDAIFQNKFLDEENSQLARNLTAWLLAAK